MEVPDIPLDPIEKVLFSAERETPPCSDFCSSLLKGRPGLPGVPGERGPVGGPGPEGPRVSMACAHGSCEDVKHISRDREKKKRRMRMAHKDPNSSLALQDSDQPTALLCGVRPLLDHCWSEVLAFTWS